MAKPSQRFCLPRLPRTQKQYELPSTFKNFRQPATLRLQPHHPVPSATALLQPAKKNQKKKTPKLYSALLNSLTEYSHQPNHTCHCHLPHVTNDDKTSPSLIISSEIQPVTDTLHTLEETEPYSSAHSAHSARLRSKKWCNQARFSLHSSTTEGRPAQGTESARSNQMQVPEQKLQIQKSAKCDRLWTWLRDDNERHSSPPIYP